MQSSDLVSSFGEIARAKDIDRDTLQLVIEDVFRTMVRKRYGSDEAFEIIFNPEQGDIMILHIREVVPDWDLEDPVTQIELSEAKEVDPDFEVGDEVASEVDVADFGRRAVMTARQTFRQGIRDLEKEKIYEEYSKLIGEIVVGEIYQVRRDVLLMHEGVEMLLPRSGQIRGEHYRKGDMLRTVVKEVRRDPGSDPQVIVSRTDEVFMERLFEVEVPEIYEGIVEIKKVARFPGDRAKVAVTSHDERVDPVGACVGVKGVRIHSVVRELNNENIDVLEWAEDPHRLIMNALSPANPTSVTINEEADPPRATVRVPADEVSQAIGKGGVNIRLATKLTGYELDVYRDIPEDEEDIDIEEFGDALTRETIEQLKMIGCDTGKAVLELSVDELTRRSGLDEDLAARILDIIRTEFEEGPTEAASLFDQPFTLEAPGAKEEAGEDVAAVEEEGPEEKAVQETADEETAEESTSEETAASEDLSTNDDEASETEQVQAAPAGEAEEEAPASEEKKELAEDKSRE